MKRADGDQIRGEFSETYPHVIFLVTGAEEGLGLGPRSRLLG